MASKGTYSWKAEAHTAGWQRNSHLAGRRTHRWLAETHQLAGRGTIRCMDGSGTIRWRQVADRDPLSWLADARSGGWQKNVGGFSEAGRGGLLLIGGI